MTTHNTQTNFTTPAQVIYSLLSPTNRDRSSVFVIAHTLKLLTQRWGFERAYNHVRASLGV